MMRSMWTILNAEINTKAEATAIIDEETPQYAAALGITEEAARQQLKDNIGYLCWYYSEAEAERIMELFETQHPIFGRHRLSPEEEARLTHEDIERRMKERI
jgi:hypothetical protein